VEASDQLCQVVDADHVLGVRPKSDKRQRCSGRTPFNGLA
jgi:hypothetical protein